MFVSSCRIAWQLQSKLVIPECVERPRQPWTDKIVRAVLILLPTGPFPKECLTAREAHPLIRLSARLCENSVHGSTGFTTNGNGDKETNYLAVRPACRRAPI